MNWCQPEPAASRFGNLPRLPLVRISASINNNNKKKKNNNKSTIHVLPMLLRMTAFAGWASPFPNVQQRPFVSDAEQES